MPTIKLDSVKLKKQIDKLRNLHSRCDNSRYNIDYKSDQFNNPSPEADSFYVDVAQALHQVKERYETLETHMNRIIEINQNGIGSRDTTTGIISIDVPDTVEQQGTSGFDVWSQGTIDAHDLSLINSGKTSKSGRSYAEVKASMESGKDSIAYSAGFIDTIGPENLTSLPIDLQGSGRPGESHIGKDEAENLAILFGDLLANASRTWDDDKCQKVADQMVSTVNDVEGYQRIPVLNAIFGGHDSNGDYINDLDFNASFLLAMGEATEKIDYDKVMSYFAGGGTLGPRDKPSGFSDYSLDPLAGVLDAMGNDPKAALDFLAPANSSGDGADTSRLERLSQRWNKYDDPRHAYLGEVDTDGFSGLTAAIAAASTERDSDDLQIRQRADNLADSSIHSIAKNVHQELYDEHAKGRIAMLLANCTGEVTSSWNEHGGRTKNLADPDKEAFSDATGADLDALVYRVIDSDTAAATLSADLVDYANTRADDGLALRAEDDTSGKRKAIRQPYSEADKALGHLSGLASARADADIAAHKKTKEETEQNASTIMNVATAVAAGGLGAVAGPPGVIGSTAVSAGGAFLTPIVVNDEGNAGATRAVTANTSANGSQALWAHAVEHAAQAGILNQTDYTAADNTGKSTADKYDWIKQDENGQYTIDLENADSNTYAQVQDWTRRINDKSSQNNSLPPDDNLEALDYDTYGIGRSEGESSGHEFK